MTKPPTSQPNPEDEPHRESGDDDVPPTASGPSGGNGGGLFSNGFPTFHLSRQGVFMDAAWFHGRKIGDYQVCGQLGEGGMSWVFEASQPVLNSRVALKISKPGTDQRLETEANLLNGIEHAGIAKVYAGGRVETSAGWLSYMATELITDGSHLDDYCRQHLHDIHDRVALFADVCAAVAHAHRKGLIHRDLKPSNILVDPKGRPKVIDFGIARQQSTDSGKPKTQSIAGTAGYMSPEQQRGEPLTTASDVYTLGLILEKLLSPERTTPAGRMPRGLKRIIKRCLEYDPDRRPADAGQLEKALRRWLRWQPPAWLDPQRATWPATTARWLHEHRWAIARGSLAALLATAVIWAVFLRPDMRSFARAVAAAAEQITPENPAGDVALNAEAARFWRLARPFSDHPPLELAWLANQTSEPSAARLVARGAAALAVGTVPEPWAAVGYPGGIAIFDVGGDARGLVCRIGSPEAISAVTFSADGSQLLAGDDAGRVLVWNTAALRGSPRNTMPGRADLGGPDTGGVLALASAPNAAWCIALAGDGGIFRIDPPDGSDDLKAERIATVPDGRDIALLDSGRLLAVACGSGVVEFRDLSRPVDLLRSEQIGSGSIDLACDETGQTLYAVAPGRLCVWRAPRSTAATSVSVPATDDDSPPRVVFATRDACLIAFPEHGESSLHCLRDIRGRVELRPRWEQTLSVQLPAEIEAAAWLPGPNPELVSLDPRGYLSTSR